MAKTRGHMTEGLRFVTLRSGEPVPALGQGTWHMGENRRRAAEEAAALRLGIDLGMTLIDTAEMYGSGGAEEVVARAADGIRDGLSSSARSIRTMPQAPVSSPPASAASSGSPPTGSIFTCCIGAARCRSPRPWRAFSG